MGWNELKSLRGPLFEGIDDGAHVYFANSFAADVAETTAATADHGGPFSAALQAGHVFGVQFHPEKSGPVGARLLRNFLAL
jgi:glutamine amidotransferase